MCGAMCGSIWYLTHVTSIQCLHNLHAVSSLSRPSVLWPFQIAFCSLVSRTHSPQWILLLETPFSFHLGFQKKKNNNKKNTQTHKQTNKQTNNKQTNKRKKAWWPGHFLKWLVGPETGNNFVRPSQYWKGWPQVLYFISLGKANLWYGVASSEW